eukprot:940870-Lingulodinium_polyedra.AAC.1
MDDHTLCCDPRIVPDVLKTVDEKTEMPERGGRNKAKTRVIYYATDDEMQSNGNVWKLDVVRDLAT